MIARRHLLILGNLPLLLWSLASCTTVVQIPITEPPEIMLAPGSQEIIFVSRFDTSLIASDDEKIVDTYHESYKAFVMGLDKGFKDIDHLSLKVADTLIGGKSYTTEVPTFTDTTRIIQFLDRYQPNYLITLDAFRLERFRDEEQTEYGGSMGYYLLEANAALAVFDQSGQPTDKMLVTDSQFIDNNFNGIFFSAPELGEYAKLAAPLCYDLGYQYATMFIPFETFVTDFMYSGKDFKPVLSLVEKDQWSEARSAATTADGT